MSALKAILYGAFMWTNKAHQSFPSLTPAQFEMVNAIPGDIRTVISRLDLEPDIIRYAVCPKCRATYAPNPKKPGDPYPRTCTFRETDKGVCSEKLVVKRESTYEPIAFFPYRSIHSWIGEMLLRPGLAALSRGAWIAAEASPSPWKDIWHAPLLRNFLGPAGRTPFSAQQEDSVHLVFTLFYSL